MLTMLRKNYLITACCLILVVAFASVWAVYVLGAVALDRHNLEWLWGDLSQVHVAWVQFLSDPSAGWLTTDRLSYPLPLSISLFDPMPILLLLARPLSGSLANGQQFFGWYFVACLVLQGAFGYMATLQAQRLVGGSHSGLRYYVAILGGILFASIPFTFFRFVGHTALSSQWVLVLSAWATLATLHSPHRRWLLVNGLVLFLATGLNPYLALLVLISTSVVTLVRGWCAFPWQVALRIGALAVIAGIGLKVFGFVDGAGASTGGYGLYSMNILGPLDSNGRAALFGLDVLDPTGGQSFEGYNYLGFGLLALCAFMLVSFLNYKAEATRFPFVAVFLVIVICYFLALSTKVTLSGHNVDIPVPQGIGFLLERFRASGRLFWMAGLWVIVASMSAAVLRWGQFRGAVLLTFVVIIQLMDVRPIAHDVRSSIANGKALSLDVAVALPVTGVFVFPAWQCDHYGTPGGVRNYEMVGRFASTHGIPTNNFYAARITDEQVAFHCNIEQRLAKIDPNALYLISSEVYATHASKFEGGFECRQRSGPERVDNYWICLPGEL
jgi:hypothetical protein